MLRKFILKNTVSGVELVLPVTPAGYQIEHGRKAVSVDMHQVGQVNLPGLPVLLDETLECLLPAQAYPFAQSGSDTNPFVPLELLEKWSDAGDPCRFIVSDTPVNALVLIDPIVYTERDGTNDIYCTIPLRGYRVLSAQSYGGDGQATGGQRELESAPAHAGSYTVVKGDTLSAIARRFYGDANKYPALAAANGIQNPHLIFPGQSIALPESL